MSGANPPAARAPNGAAAGMPTAAPDPSHATPPGDGAGAAPGPGGPLIPASQAAPLPAGKQFSDLPLPVQNELLRLDVLVLDGVPTAQPDPIPPLGSDAYIALRQRILRPLDPGAAGGTLTTASGGGGGQGGSPPPRGPGSGGAGGAGVRENGALQRNVSGASSSGTSGAGAASGRHAAGSISRQRGGSTPPAFDPTAVGTMTSAFSNDSEPPPTSSPTPNHAAAHGSDVGLSASAEGQLAGGGEVAPPRANKRRTLVIEYAEDTGSMVGSGVNEAVASMAEAAAAFSPVSATVAAGEGEAHGSVVGSVPGSLRERPVSISMHSTTDDARRRSLFSQAEMRDGGLLSPISPVEEAEGAGTGSQPMLDLPSAAQNAAFAEGHMQPPTALRTAPPLVDPATQAPLVPDAWLPGLIAGRSATTPQTPVLRLLDSAGSEAAPVLTWAALYQRAQSLAALLEREPPPPMPANASAAAGNGEEGGVPEPLPGHVALVYRREELGELLTALVATWLAGRVPVVVPAPHYAGVTAAAEDDALHLDLMLQHARATTALSTDQTLRATRATMQARGLAPPPHMAWRDSSAVAMGTASNARPPPPLVSPAPDGHALVTFVTGASGDIKALAVPHAALSAHMHSLAGALQLTPADTCLLHFDVRCGFPLHLVLAGIFAGAVAVVAPAGGQMMDLGALYLGLAARYHATLLPLTAGCVQRLAIQGTAKLGPPPKTDLEAVRCVLLLPGGNGSGPDAVVPPRTVRTAQAKLAPHLSQRVLWAPVLTLPELGGLAIAMHDALPESAALIASGVAELQLDRMSLHQKRVVMIEPEGGQAGGVPPGAMHVTAGGLLMPRAIACIVTPHSPRALVQPNQPGELYVRAPFLAGLEYLSQPLSSAGVFKQRPLFRGPEGTLSQAPTADWVRTGYYGCLIDGNVIVALGRVRDAVLGPPLDFGEAAIEGAELGTGKRARIMHFPADIASSVQALVKGIDVCVMISVPNPVDLCLPVVILETTRLQNELPSVAMSALALIQEIHHLDCFAVLCLAPGSLPRAPDQGFLVPARVVKVLPYLQPMWVSVHTHCLPRNVPQPALPPSSQEQHTMTVAPLGGLEPKYRTIVDVVIRRSEKYPDKDAYILATADGQPAKTISWRKLTSKIAALSSMLIKKGVRPGDHVLLVYAHSIDYVIACHACIYLGIIPIPMPPPDSNRMQEDVPTLLHLCADFSVAAILCNAVVDELLRSKQFMAAVKRLLPLPTLRSMPAIHNTSRLAKTSKVLGQDGLRLDDMYLTNRDIPAVLQAYFDADMARTIVKVSHAKILEQCAAIAATLRCSSSKPGGAILSSVRTYNGLGFLFAVAMGPFLCTPTVLFPPFEFSRAPRTLFELMRAYNVAHTYVTWPMLEYAIEFAGMDPAQLHAQLPASLRAMLVALDAARAPVLGAPQKLVPMLGRPGNAFITGTSAVRTPLSADPTQPVPNGDPGADDGGSGGIISVGLAALRRGRLVLAPETAKDAVPLVSAGPPIPASTVVIVDPVSCEPVGADEIGELWVSSLMNCDGEVRQLPSGDIVQSALPPMFSSLTGYPGMTFCRTGEYAALYQDRVYVIGKVNDVLVVDGMLHFAPLVEASVEACHPLVAPDGVVVFMSGKRLVIVVEVADADDENDQVAPEHVLCSVPVICLAVYLHHGLVVDTVVFLQPGMLAKSRLYEKQRVKVKEAFVKNHLYASASHFRDSLILQWTTVLTVTLALLLIFA